MHEKQQVADMADEVSKRQARLQAEQTEGTPEGSLNEVVKTEPDQMLGELRDGAHRGEDLAPKQAEEHKRAQRQERDRAQREANWERFMQTEMQELELRKDGQLGRMLGEPLAGESTSALKKLSAEDRRQAEQGMVAVMRNGELSYKHVGELTEEDMPARVAASRLRTTWLKERRDGWLADKEGRG